MQLKFEIIWMRIGQIIRLQNINFSETPCILKGFDFRMYITVKDKQYEIVNSVIEYLLI